MDTAIEVVEGAHLVRVSGEVDLVVAAELRDSVERARSVDDERAVVFDLEGVTFIDSTGLNELVRPTLEGYSVTLRRPSAPVRRLLELTGVSELFTVAAD